MLILLIPLLAQEILLSCILIPCICRPPQDIITVLRGQYPFRLARVRMGSSSHPTAVWPLLPLPEEHLPQGSLLCVSR